MYCVKHDCPQRHSSFVVCLFVCWFVCWLANGALQQSSSSASLSSAVKPKKPRPPYFRFCMQRRAQLKRENPQASFADLGRMLGEAWRALTEEERAQFEAPMDDEGERDEREKLQRRGTSKDLLRAAQEHQYQLFLQQQQLLLQQREQEPLLLLQQKEHSEEGEVPSGGVQQREEERDTKDQDQDKEEERDSENERVLFTAPPPLNAVSSDSGLSSPAENARRGQEQGGEERAEEGRAPRIDTSVGALGLQQSSSSALPSPASFSSVPSLQHMFRSSFAFAPSFSSPFPPPHEHMQEESADVRAQRIAHSQIMMGAHYPHPYAHAHPHVHPMMLPFGGAPPAIPFTVPPVAVDTANAASSSAAAAAAIAEATFTSSAAATSAQFKSKKGKAAKRSILATVSEDQEKCSNVQREEEKEGESASTPAKKKTKRRPSGFILFAREQRRHVVDQFPAATFSEIGKILGLLWAQQSREQKQVYVDAAKDWTLS